jgi:hypothetical protein
MNVRVTMIAVALAVALAVPAAVSAGTAKHDPGDGGTAPAAQLSASAVPSSCTLALTDGYLWGYTCDAGPHGTTDQPAAHATVDASGMPVVCTLSLSVGYLWGYDCPFGAIVRYMQ